MVKITNKAGGQIDFPGHGLSLKPGASYVKRLPADLHSLLLAQASIFLVELVDDEDVPQGTTRLELPEPTAPADEGPSAHPVARLRQELEAERAQLEADKREHAGDVAELERARQLHQDQLNAKGIDFDNDLAEERKLFDGRLEAERAQLEADKAALAAEREAFEKTKAPADKPAEG